MILLAAACQQPKPEVVEEPSASPSVEAAVEPEDPLELRLFPTQQCRITLTRLEKPTEFLDTWVFGDDGMPELHPSEYARNQLVGMSVDIGSVSYELPPQMLLDITNLHPFQEENYQAVGQDDVQETWLGFDISDAAGGCYVVYELSPKKVTRKIYRESFFLDKRTFDVQSGEVIGSQRDRTGNIDWTMRPL